MASSSSEGAVAAVTTSSTTPPTSSVILDCPVCSDPIDTCFGVFDCGHFACYKCALKIRRTVRRGEGAAATTANSSNNNNNRRGNNNNTAESTAATTTSSPSPTTINGLPAKNPPNCFVCRKQIATLTITEMAPKNPESYIYEKSEMEILTKLDNVNTKKFLPLNCYVTSTKCAVKLQSLIDYLCPFDECWDVDKKTGAKSQIPFTNFDLLQRHLRQDHHGCKFCDTCASQSVSFLSELHVYTPQEMRNHMNGTCAEKDSQAFTGHPSCHFCHNKTLLDGESMLEHLKHIHYVCDFCNMSSYKFTYYNDRESLNRHWAADHKLCTHPECAQLDPVARVFAGEIDLAKHMQERHNVKSKSLSLEAFGFRFDNEIVLSGNNNNNGGASAANVQQMATQAAVGNTIITYDFVGSVTRVPLVPRSLQQNNNDSSSNNNNNNNNNNRNGGRRQPRPSKNNNSNNNDNDNDTTPNNINNNSSQQQDADQLAKQKMNEANDNIQSIVNGLPSKQRDIFNDAVKKFLKQEIKAVEFFNVLHTKVVTEEDVLEFLFDNFAETLRRHPNPALRDALISAKAIILSAEAKRNKEALKEERDQLAREQRQAKIKQLHQMTLQPGAGFSGGSGSSVLARGKPVSQVGGGNAWHQRQAASSNPETSNIHKKSVASPPSMNNNPWTKKMGDHQGSGSGSAMLGAAGGSGTGSGSDDFLNFTSTTTSSANNNNNNARKNTNNHNQNQQQQPPSINEAFPTLQTTTRKGNPHPNQPANVKGDWKSNRLVKN